MLLGTNSMQDFAKILLALKTVASPPAKPSHLPGGVDDTCMRQRAAHIPEVFGQ